MVRLIRRRGWWMVAIGVAHVVLLWSGDIVAAYGLLTAALAGMVVTGTAVSLATTAVVGSVLGARPRGVLGVLAASGTRRCRRSRCPTR